MTRVRTAGTVLIMLSATALDAKDTSPPEPTIQPDWSEVRRASEAALLPRLVDPRSAQIQWQRGFRWASYKPFLKRRVYGWTGCGLVNAKNRMGGYTGPVAFAIVYSAGSVALLDMDDDGSLGIVGGQCDLLKLPAPQPGLSSQEANVPSVADELLKLVRLRDDGVLTSAEFDAQKAKLLAR